MMHPFTIEIVAWKISGNNTRTFSSSQKILINNPDPILWDRQMWTKTINMRCGHSTFWIQWCIKPSGNQGNSRSLGPILDRQCVLHLRSKGSRCRKRPRSVSHRHSMTYLWQNASRFSLLCHHLVRHMVASAAYRSGKHPTRTPSTVPGWSLTRWIGSTPQACLFDLHDRFIQKGPEEHRLLLLLPWRFQRCGFVSQCCLAARKTDSSCFFS